ncbi:23811_t:CDS:2 [Gigaspora margarita]|uniref:23811_t:CDS:1 n=1 Tax=Gigaspora margarita TaxID=4874 RepID=A0ABN7UTG4_GIGMA|nr:23811_t:CDS:2 [Gigaspora margarita]
MENIYRSSNTENFFNAKSIDLLISDDIFEPSNTENYEFGNAENFFNTEFVDLLIFDNMYKPSNTNNYESIDPLMSGSCIGLVIWIIFLVNLTLPSNQDNEAVKCIENSSSSSSNKSISLNVAETCESQNNEEYSELRYPIKLNKSFKDWEDLDEWFNNLGLESGFTFTITYSEKDKRDRIPWCCTYKYAKGRPMYLEKKHMLLITVIVVIILLAIHFMLMHISTE